MAALLAATVLVGGCGGGGEPEAEPTPILPSSSSPSSPSTSESEAAEETAPEMPEAAKRDSEEGAESFMEYWTDTYNYATQSGDTSTFDEISADNCKSCARISQMVNDLYESGGYFEAQNWKILQLAFAPDSGAQYPVVRFDRGRERVFQPEKSKPEVFNAEDRTYTFQLERARNGWVVREFAEAS